MTVTRRHGRIPRVPAAFIMTESAVRAAVRPPGLVVLRAARGFGKTATLASWLRSDRFAGYDSIWVPLSAPTEPGELWQAIREGLSALHGDVRGEQSTMTAIRRMLDARSRRLALVLDGLHFVGHGDHGTMTVVDDALVELVHDFPLLHLFVASRSERPIEVLGRASVDALILRRSELALGEREVLALARELGRDLTPAQTAELTSELLGWPAIVRAVLLDRGALGSDAWHDVSVRVATHFGRALFAASDTAALLPVIGAVAIAGGLSEGELTSLEGGERLARHLPQLAAIGFVDDRGRYRAPGVLQRAITQLVREDYPDLFQQLNSMLARLRHVQRRHEEALQRAVEAHEWQLAASIADEAWTALLNDGSPALRHLVEHLPPELVAKYPTLVMCRDVIHAPYIDQRTRAAIRSGVLRLEGHGAVQPATLTEKLVGLQRLDHPNGWRILEWNELPAATQAALPGYLLEWGASLLRDGVVARAVYVFALARARAERSGNQREAVEAAALIAAAVGRLGHLNTAEKWLRRAREGGEEGSAVAHAAMDVAARHTQLLRLSPASPLPQGSAATVEDATLLTLQELAHVDDIHYGLVRHGRMGLDSEARLSATSSPLTAAVAQELKIDAFIVSGRLDRAEEILADLSEPLTVQRARFAFYSGAPDETLRLLGGEHNDASVFTLRGLEIWLLQACAALRSSQLELARDYLGAALALAEDTGNLLPFLFVPRGDLLEIADGDSYAQDFINQPALRNRETRFIEPLHTVTLTTAERRVLSQLARDIPLIQVGRALFIAESTVKTHVRSIYRKFGVTTRSEALARGRALLLID